MLDNSHMEDDSRETCSERDEQKETNLFPPVGEAIERQDIRSGDEADSPSHAHIAEAPGGSYFKPGGSVPMRCKKFTLLSGGALLLILVATLFTSSSPASSQKSESPISLFQKATCPFPLGAGLVEGREVDCGYLTVPENRASKNGKTIKLAVAIFHALQYLNTRDPNPVVRLDGGPGGPSLNSIATLITAQNYKAFVFNHDLILFDQRGVGYSTPSLACSELGSGNGSLLSEKYEQAAFSCYKRLLAQGIDLNGFNTIQNADDVADLIKELGYQQATLYGVSYGTRLALTVMRLHPSVVRAVILDSVYPTTHKSFNLPKVAQHVFNALFAGCNANAVCSLKYPNLEKTFYNLVDRLNTSPTTFTYIDPATQKLQKLFLSGDDLVILLFNLFYSASLIPQIPLLINQLNTQLITGNTATPSTLATSSELTGQRSDGMFFSVECSEDYPFLTRQELLDEQQGVPSQIARPMGIIGSKWYDVCQFWKVDTVPDAQKQAVLSNLPALVLSGEYDPITPPANAQEVTSDLSHSFAFFFPGLSHGEEYNAVCSDLIISAFSDSPDQPPSGACIAQMTEPAFQ